MDGTPSRLSQKIQILGAVIVFSVGVALALRKADFALKKISPLPYCQPPLASSFVLIPTLSEWSGLALAYPH